MGCEDMERDRREERKVKEKRGRMWAIREKGEREGKREERKTSATYDHRL